MKDFKTKFQCLKNNVASKLNKSKALITTGAIVTANSLMAEVAVDSSTGVVSGKLELGPFWSAFGVVMTALASLIVAKWVMGLIRRA